MRTLVIGLRNFCMDPSARAALAIAGGLITVGTVFYRRVEDLSWIDSLYFCVITLATVGYGDISPATTAGKIFTMFYVVIGIGIFVALVTQISHHLIAARSAGSPPSNGPENEKNLGPSTRGS